MPSQQAFPVPETCPDADSVRATLPPPQSGPYNVLVGTTTGEAFTGSTWV